MMKINILSAMLVVIFLFTSCKKDNSNNTPGDSNKLKMYIEDARNT